MSLVDLLIQGWPFGRVFPQRPIAPLPAVDPRTIALRVLAEYFAALKFNRPGDKGGDPIPFRVEPKDIHIDRPDGVQDLNTPSIVFLPGNDEYLSLGLTAYLDESTRDKFGKGTVLQEQYEYREIVNVTVVSAKLPQRRALMAGIEVALVPSEQMYGVRFRMPEYYDQTVCFTLWGGTRTDDPAMIKNLRWGVVQVEMRFHVVTLVNYVQMQPEVGVEVYDPDAVPIGVEIPDGASGTVTEEGL